MKTTDKILHEAKDKAKDAENGIENMANIILENAHVAQAKIEDASKKVSTYINKHPVKSTVIAGITCYVLGRLVGMIKK